MNSHENSCCRQETCSADFFSWLNSRWRLKMLSRALALGVGAKRMSGVFFSVGPSHNKSRPTRSKPYPQAPRLPQPHGAPQLSSAAAPPTPSATPAPRRGVTPTPQPRATPQLSIAARPQISTHRQPPALHPTGCPSPTERRTPTPPPPVPEAPLHQCPKPQFVDFQSTGE